MSVSTNPSDTLTLVKPLKRSKKAIHYHTFIAGPEGSFVVKAEELTESLQNFLEELERANF